MAPRRLYSRHVVGRLESQYDAGAALATYLPAGFRALQSVGDPDWTTLSVTLDRSAEDLAAGQHILTITASSKED